MLRVRAAPSSVRSRWRRAPGERDGWTCRPAPWGRPRWSQRPKAASVHGPTAAGRRGGARGGARALRPRRAGGARQERGGLSGPAAASAKCGGGRAESPTSGSALGRGGPLRGPLADMSAAKENPCRKFQANIFNKSKCQNCFKPRESHLLNDEDLTQAKPIYGGWLLLAPDGTDFTTQCTGHGNGSDDSSSFMSMASCDMPWMRCPPPSLRAPST